MPGTNGEEVCGEEVRGEEDRGEEGRREAVVKHGEGQEGPKGGQEAPGQEGLTVEEPKKEKKFRENREKDPEYGPWRRLRRSLRRRGFQERALGGGKNQVPRMLAAEAQIEHGHAFGVKCISDLGGKVHFQTLLDSSVPHCDPRKLSTGMQCNLAAYMAAIQQDRRGGHL